MSHQCRTPAETLAALDLPKDDPRHRHVQDCSACHAVVLAYEEFMDPAAAHTAQEIDAAEAELAARMRTDPARSDLPQIGGRRKGNAIRSSFRRPLLALAAALTVAAAILVVRDGVMLRDPQLPLGPGAIRGVSPQEAAPEWTLEPAGIRLNWSLPTGAEEVVAVLYDTGMRELHRVGVGATTTLVLDDGFLPAQVSIARVAFAQLYFVAAGDTISRSHLASLR